ncbi:TauD/TfdA family dioxygenase [Micromonospora narathiwatensis]|uniref:L-asparagine oxygenase n=1 Tax=Micromonospora narathiwatensis TaxID=299146 RepID=A0A1A8ZPN6_9ACTN|nr:TauD/TfdA family dioxygenase [Micromonospora narathiwatensis]SBT46073.1 L-asparagine oxygenase [Micromonospora narathiwatensis]
MTLDQLTRTPQGLTLDLTDDERAALGELARQLVATPPALLDDLAWLAQVRQASCRLPLRLMATLRAFRNDAGATGALILTGLPVDEDGLPETPSERESVERAATVPAVVAMLVGLQLGEVIAYRNEKTGALVQNVVPVPGLEGTQSNAGSVPLEFHVENAFHPQRPDYVGLLCLRNDHAKRAGTLVTCIRQALPLIEETDRKVLREPRFITAPPPSFHHGDRTMPHPVLTGSPEDPNICLDLNATAGLDDEAREVMARLKQILTDVSTSLVLQSGSMAIIDNRLVLHGRTEFTPRFDGRDRWLHRVYVHLDNRRSRAHRDDAGAVLN